MRIAAMLTLCFCGHAFADGCLSFADIQGIWETKDTTAQFESISFEQESETFFYASGWNQVSFAGQWEISGCTLTLKPKEEAGLISFLATPGRPHLWLAPKAGDKRVLYVNVPD